MLLLCFGTAVFAQAQLANVRTYDFRDGTIIAAGKSTDSTLMLSGNYSFHSASYGLNMKVNGEISLRVSGSCTIRFLGSKYSALKMTGTATTSGDLGTQDTRVINDLNDVFDFVYSGRATTLKFKLIPGSGNDLYLPRIDLIPAQSGIEATAPAPNIAYYFDFRDGSIVPTNTDGKSGIVKGLLEIKVGNSNAYGYNGTQHGAVFKTGNQILLKVAGNTRIKVGGSIYSNGTIAASATTGQFDMSSQSSTTKGNFGNDGSTVDFLYVGTEGIVTLSFSGTNYVPYLEISPVPYPVTLTTYVQKAGSITVNNVQMNLQMGATLDSPPTLSLSEGTLISAGNQSASVRINLSGKPLSSYQPTFTGDIGKVTSKGDSLLIAFKDTLSNPKSYIIEARDNSVVVEAEAGKTYTYNFFDGSEMPKTSYQQLRYRTFVTRDGILAIQSNTSTAALQFGYHDATHGGVFFPGNSFELIVAGNAIVTFIVDTYGVAKDAAFEFKDASGKVLGSIRAENLGAQDGFPSSFSYKGPKGKITATLVSASFPTAEIYLHGLSVENAAATTTSNGKIDAWDFGAEQLDSLAYNNQLNTEIINSWYNPSIQKGSAGNVLPSTFNTGVLSWVGGTNDRLRTTNLNLTRYDQNIASVSGYSGRIYVNAAAASGRFLSFTLKEDDVITLVTKTDAGGILNFEYVEDPTYQKDIVPITSDLTELSFVAKAAGTYHVYDTQGKPSYYRVLRKDARYLDLTGHIDLSNAAGIPAGYGLVFTNQAGKEWVVTPTGSSYQAKLPIGFSYTISLAGANGFILSSGDSLTITDSTLTHDIVLAKVSLQLLSGKISGLGNYISKLSLQFVPDPAANKVFVPQPVIKVDSATYTVLLEPLVTYSIIANGINDFALANNQIRLAEKDSSADLSFTAKPTYAVHILTEGLNTTEAAALGLVFNNLNESGYAYPFTNTANIRLRNGTYRLTQTGLDAYPVQLKRTSNLKVTDKDTSKTLRFMPVMEWSFDDRVIANGDTTYKGMLLSGTAYNEILKGHLGAKDGAVIKVPVVPGEKVSVTYYYTASFSFEGGKTFTSNTQSTSVLETADFIYPGTEPGYVVIKVGAEAATTYFTHIARSKVIPYKPLLLVGATRDYPSINAALEAVRGMERPDNQRVTIQIDPGNYEEMLVIDRPNITLRNAASTPDIALRNKGVDISSNAVRVTSYYGHGYNYFSMGNTQKWDTEILQVNKENGYLSYENKGAGTTNGSYWNATVTVFANGFEAEQIIFENSFNQYISKKESEDIVVQWTVGGKGVRPTNPGNTAVQNRSYVERAAALAIGNNIDKVVLNKCRVVGRQDALFGGINSRVVVYKGSVMGAVDYIFGGMVAVFYQTDLAMNTSDVSGDAAYLTAAQQSAGRGYLMYECTVTSAVPGTETASTSRAKPGYFGRPWQATTSEVVFYNTTIQTSDYPGNNGQSLIAPAGWQNSLGGESSKMYEYGTKEQSGTDNSSARASWATLLKTPVLSDGTAITTFNFTKGTDGWDPLPALIAADITGTRETLPESSVHVYSYGKSVFLQQIPGKTQVEVIDLHGRRIRTFQTWSDMHFELGQGLWIIRINAPDGVKTAKVTTF